jgi:hypothetical protein
MRYSENAKFEEKMFEKKQCVVSAMNTDLSDKLLFVVRGKIV